MGGLAVSPSSTKSSLRQGEDSSELKGSGNPISQLSQVDTCLCDALESAAGGQGRVAGVAQTQVTAGVRAASEGRSQVAERGTVATTRVGRRGDGVVIATRSSEEGGDGVAEIGVAGRRHGRSRVVVGTAGEGGQSGTQVTHGGRLHGRRRIVGHTGVARRGDERGLRGRIRIVAGHDARQGESGQRITRDTSVATRVAALVLGRVTAGVVRRPQVGVLAVRRAVGAGVVVPAAVRSRDRERHATARGEPAVFGTIDDGAVIGRIHAAVGHGDAVILVAQNLFCVTRGVALGGCYQHGVVVLGVLLLAARVGGAADAVQAHALALFRLVFAPRLIGVRFTSVGLAARLFRIGGAILDRFALRSVRVVGARFRGLALGLLGVLLAGLDRLALLLVRIRLAILDRGLALGPGISRLALIDRLAFRAIGVGAAILLGFAFRLLRIRLAILDRLAPVRLVAPVAVRRRRRNRRGCRRNDRHLTVAGRRGHLALRITVATATAADQVVCVGQLALGVQLGDGLRPRVVHADTAGGVHGGRSVADGLTVHVVHVVVPLDGNHVLYRAPVCRVDHVFPRRTGAVHVGLQSGVCLGGVLVQERGDLPGAVQAGAVGATAGFDRGSELHIDLVAEAQIVGVAALLDIRVQNDLLPTVQNLGVVDRHDRRSGLPGGRLNLGVIDLLVQVDDLLLQSSVAGLEVADVGPLHEQSHDQADQDGHNRCATGDRRELLPSVAGRRRTRRRGGTPPPCRTARTTPTCPSLGRRIAIAVVVAGCRLGALALHVREVRSEPGSEPGEPQEHLRPSEDGSADDSGDGQASGETRPNTLMGDVAGQPRPQGDARGTGEQTPEGVPLADRPDRDHEGQGREGDRHQHRREFLHVDGLTRGFLRDVVGRRVVRSRWIVSGTHGFTSSGELLSASVLMTEVAAVT